VLVGNTDDHPRNHAAFWDGKLLTLTPAYDICPQPRNGGEAAQLMAIAPSGWRMSQVAGCVQAAAAYQLSTAEARAIVDDQIATIESRWDEVCDKAAMTSTERRTFWRRQFLNPYATEGYTRHQR
jgi:serine/threonine-protein kinase HipA